MSGRPLIEQWFPGAIVGAESLRERASASSLPPLNFLHVWWARRPLASSRAAVAASLLPAWPEDEEVTSDERAAALLKILENEFPGGEKEYRGWLLQLLGIRGDPVSARRRIAGARETGERLADGGYGYPRAFTVSPDTANVDRFAALAAARADVGDPLVVLDPFAGGGSIPFEAARLGAFARANELNPVAGAILHATLTLPIALGSQFASRIQSYGKRWADRVGTRLAPFFPKQPGDASIVAYIWAHAVPCPTTGRPTPLSPDFWLARGKAGKDVALHLEVDANLGTLTYEVIEGKGAAEYGNRSTFKNGVGQSIWTGETFNTDYIVERANEGRLSEMLMAICITRPAKTGRHFRAPSPEDLDAVEAARLEVERSRPQWEVDDLVPLEARFIGPADRSARYGIRYAYQLYSFRQLLTSVTALSELRTIVHEIEAELGTAEAKALNLYLAFAFDIAMNYNGRLSSWHTSRLSIRPVFDRHDFSFKWSFAEMDGASALFPWAVFQVFDSYQKMAPLIADADNLLEARTPLRAEVTVGSATNLSIPDRSVDAIVTDPPYYDNVMYAECADYFYVWEKRTLRDTWPELVTQVLTNKEDEAVANNSLFREVAGTRKGRKKTGEKSADELADEHYERLLTQSFREAHRVLKDDGVLTVMFTHKRVDAWDTLGQSLLEAGFSINSSWPVHTESEHSLHQAKKNAASSTIFLTCRKRGDTSPAYWTDIRGEVIAAARQSATEFAEDGLVGIDLTLATFGPVLSVLSRNWPVYTGELDAEGSPQVLRPDAALDLAREEVARLKKRGLLGGRDVEFDRVTDWYLLAWADFAAAEFPYDEARKLSIATHLELDDLARQHRLIRAASGNVTLLTPAQRRTAKGLDPDAAAWPTLIDALHALMLTYDEEGLPAARAWLERTGKGDDPRFADLVAAALHAIPRVRDKGEFARPEARTIEGLRATLFEQIPAPVEPEDVGSAQAVLFE